MKSKVLLNSVLSLSLVWLSLGWLARPAPVLAATLTVNSTNDVDDGLCDASHCSLREAINAANAASGPDTISFSLSIPATITLNATLPVITTEITLTGPGADQLTISGNNTVRVMQIDPPGNLTLNGVTIANGNSSTPGGGIVNYGVLTLNNSAISGNRAVNANGGGISNVFGTLTVNNSTISGNAGNFGAGIGNDHGTVTLTDSLFANNTAANDGGGINSGGTLVVNHTTFSGNTAYLGGGIVTGGTTTVTDSTFVGNSTSGLAGGGGIMVAGGTVDVNTSTFSGNYADGTGGALFNADGTVTINSSTISNNSSFVISGIFNHGTMTVTHSTISGNVSSTEGAGIFNDDGSTFNLDNTIVADNTGVNSSSDISGTITSQGYNVIGNTSGGTITGDTTGNLIDAAASPLNLGALADNGGPNQTMALGAGSVAINAGDPTFIAPPNFDQRGSGFPRVVGGRIDIGAYEAQNITLLFNPTTASFGTGNTTTVNIDVVGAANLYGYQFQVNYDASKVSATGAFVNSFFDTTGALIPPGWSAQCAAGVCQFAASRVSPAPIVSGSGTLAQITFTGLTPSTVPLTFSNEVLSDRNGQVITDTTNTITLTVYGYANLNGTVKLQGRTSPGDTTGTVTLTDTGSVFAPITVTIAANGTWIANNVPVLPSGTTYRLDAAHSLYLGNRGTTVALQAGSPYAVPATVLKGGDANNDGTISIGDLSCIGGDFGGAPGTCGGLGSSDINGDGTVNILDLVLAAGNYGLTAPRPW